MQIKEIEVYINELRYDEACFKKQDQSSSVVSTVPARGIIYTWRAAGYIIISMLDYLLLLYFIHFKKKKLSGKRIVFTAKNFCTQSDGELEDRIVRPLFTEEIIFINQSKEIRLKRVNNQKVYNLGGLVKLISHISFRGHSSLMKTFLSYRSVNDSIIRNFRDNELYMLWYYDLNSLALIFSRYRDRVKLIEVQHGSIINYPPYVKPAPVKIAELFYVKNQSTVDYLKVHLCANFPSEYRLIPYPHVERKYVPGLHIFYASTVEFNGLHPVFKDFLKRSTYRDMNVIIRLHPREREKEGFFAEELSAFNIKYEFDHSKNWLESNRISNMIVISPWSSSLEDAYDNGLIAITIDTVGKERYKHLLDGNRFFYSLDLISTFNQITNEG